MLPKAEPPSAILVCLLFPLDVWLEWTASVMMYAILSLQVCACNRTCRVLLPKHVPSNWQ